MGNRHKYGKTKDQNLEDHLEFLLTKCPYCNTSVISYWEKGGGCIADSRYVLVADWIYHSKCWDKQIEEHPP